MGIDAFGVNASQASLGPGQTKVVKVTFYADEEGVFEDTLRFESDAINDPELDVDIIGEVVEPVCQDLDGDGHGLHCALGSDCNESDPSVHVGAPERCNGQDDDCDGLHDEDYVGLGTACEVGLGACTAPGVKICAEDEASLTCSVNPTTGGNELCNELDDDCDGATDEDFPSKNLLCQVGVGACTNYDKFICAEDGQALICNVSPGDPTDELCDDGADNDCDGIIDEGMLEVCDDGIDNDCDGTIDLPCPDCTPGYVRPCDTLCGEGFQECTEDSKWGECDAPTECLCTPGDIATQPCGNCGFVESICEDSGTWADSELCLSEGVCSPGDVETQPCGSCGTQTRTCDETCGWSEWSSCVSGGECTPGDEEAQSCGSCGGQSRFCTETCRWT